MPLSAPPNCRRTVGTKSSGQNPRGRSRFRVSHSSASRSLGDQATPPCADVQLTAVRQHCVSVSHSPREKTSQKHITPDVLVRHVSSSLQSRDRASGSSCPRTSPHATVQPAGTHGGGRGGGYSAHRGAPVYRSVEPTAAARPFSANREGRATNRRSVGTSPGLRRRECMRVAARRVVCELRVRPRVCSTTP